MKCDLSKEALVGYAFGDLADEERAKVQAHVSRCSRCQSELTALGATSEILKTWRDERPEKHLVFSPERAAWWKARLPFGSHGAGWRRWATGLIGGLAAALLVLSALNFEASYQDGDLSIRLSLMPRSEGAQDPEPIPTDAVVSREEFQAWQRESLALVQELIAASADRQERAFRATLVEFARELEAQRRQDLHLVGQGLEVVQESAEHRFRQTDELLHRLITTVQYPEPGGRMQRDNR